MLKSESYLPTLLGQQSSRSTSKTSACHLQRTEPVDIQYLKSRRHHEVVTGSFICGRTGLGIFVSASFPTVHTLPTFLLSKDPTRCADMAFQILLSRACPQQDLHLFRRPLHLPCPLPVSQLPNIHPGSIFCREAFLQPRSRRHSRAGRGPSHGHDSRIT